MVSHFLPLDPQQIQQIPNQLAGWDHFTLEARIRNWGLGESPVDVRRILEKAYIQREIAAMEAERGTAGWGHVVSSLGGVEPLFHASPECQ